VGVNADVPDGRQMLFRIGINLGDVLIEGDDILGDGVNVAARLEAISEAGGICISDSAYQQVRGMISAEFMDIGEQQLKNIARPVRAYKVSIDASIGGRMRKPPSRFLISRQSRSCRSRT
jgi:class 3 adenylate cyclase